ncbi:unnamed protein product, partial [Darwinula stevensoni]
SAIDKTLDILRKQRRSFAQRPASAQAQSLREDIRKNLEREVKFRLQARNKEAAISSLVQAASLDVPKSLVAQEEKRLEQAMRQNLKQRGMKDAETVNIPTDLFAEQALKNVRTGLVVYGLVDEQKLQAKPEQVQAHIEEIASSYEKPIEVIR